MSTIKAIWNSIRPGNLLIIAITMVAIRFVLSQLLATTLEFKYAAWGLLPLILIVASGNMINDVVDQRCDNESEKGRNPIGKTLSKEAGKRIAIALGSSGLAISFIGMSFMQTSTIILIILSVTLVLLWLYSFILQKIYFLGNLTIAVLCTVPILICSLSYGINPWSSYTTLLMPERLQLVNEVLFFYMAFAFLLTLSREFVKDIEDLEEDKSCGYRTLPIVIGIDKSRTVLAILILLIIVLEVGVIYWLRSESLLLKSAWPLIVSHMILPLLFILFKSSKIKTSKQAGPVSSLLKITMLLGLSTCLFFWFL